MTEEVQTIETPFDALVQAMMLSIKAPNKEQSATAILVAGDIVSHFSELTPEQVDVAKRVVEMLLEKERDSH